MSLSSGSSSLLANLIFVWPCVISIDGKEENQLDATVTVYWWTQISSTCFGQQFHPSSGALDCAMQLVVWRTQWMVSRWSGTGAPPLPDHRPTTHWVHHTISCITQSNAPDDGQNCCPKHIELICIYQWTFNVASIWFSYLPSSLLATSRVTLHRHIPEEWSLQLHWILIPMSYFKYITV
jgi:hypothetical protein